MAHGLNGFLDQRVLFCEVGLLFKNLFVAAISSVHVTFTFALPTEMCSIKTSLGQHNFDAFGLVWVLRMVHGKYH